MSDGYTLAGPRCRRCKSTEQDCAYNRGCCTGCSHWVGYDENGNDRPPPYGHAMPSGRICGTEVGWAKHRQDGTIPCQDCAFAHRQTKAQRLVAS